MDPTGRGSTWSRTDETLSPRSRPPFTSHQTTRAGRFMMSDGWGNIGEVDVAIVLDHTIVPAHDNEASARFFARIFGLPYEGAVSHFAPVRVNETLVLDFDTRKTFDWQHYAFKVTDTE